MACTQKCQLVRLDVYKRQGVDWTRTASATLNFFTGSRATFGGSTLTQQVLKNMTGDDGNTINRKVREIFRALEFEKNYTKQEILEMYLNTIYLGQGCYCLLYTSPAGAGQVLAGLFFS